MRIPRGGRWRRVGRRLGRVVVAAGLAACQAPDPPPPAAAVAPVEAPARLAGTWTLERIDRYDQRGDPLPAFMHPTIGLGERVGLLLADGERMAVVVQKAGRLASPGETMTPEAARAAVDGYAAYFGPYTVDEMAGHLSHLLTGSLDPGRTGGETQPFYELDGDRLVLTPGLQCPDSFVTDGGCGYGTTGVQLRQVWARVAPPADGADDETARFYGFWEVDRTDPRPPGGDGAPAAPYAEGYLVYMPSGHLAVHLMGPDRLPYEGARPTAAEAAAAMRSYVSAFGWFRVDAAAGVVVHHRTGHLDPARVGTDARRLFTFRGNQLVLEPPVPGGDRLVWNRLSALPRSGSASSG